ncbi:MAG: alpha/beta hydrolase [archaeon]|nr:alpha/beta hydrolase [archaeon]
MDISPEGEAYKGHIVELGTKATMAAERLPETVAYLDTGAESDRFEGMTSNDALRMFGADDPERLFSITEVAGCRTFRFLPRTDRGHTVLYLHGGGHVFGYTQVYFEHNRALAEECSVTVVSPDFILGSGRRRGIHRETCEQVLSVYLELVKEGRPVHLMGDSSGGALALILWQMVRERGLPSPAGLVLFSPYVDPGFSIPVDEDLAGRDITLDRPGLDGCVGLWAGDTDLSDPGISPINGRFDGIPRTIVTVGTDEIFLPSNEELARRIDEAGGDVTLVRCVGSYHIFPVFTTLPESRKVMELVRDLCGRDRTEFQTVTGDMHPPSGTGRRPDRSRPR